MSWYAKGENQQKLCDDFFFLQKQNNNIDMIHTEFKSTSIVSLYEAIMMLIKVFTNKDKKSKSIKLILQSHKFRLV